MIVDEATLLFLLQLASPALPVGAYSYSEGLEALVERGTVQCDATLQTWIEQELRYGAIRIEVAVMLRAQQSFARGDLEALAGWNAWLSAARETQELRQQSWQMGGALLKLFSSLQPQLRLMTSISPCNYAVAFGLAAAHWQISSQAAAIAYLQSWVSNLIGAGVKTIPIGQTAGQRILLNLQALLIETAAAVSVLEDNELSSCGWGLALASMAHETQYTRLFRS
ncbi:MAG: urease accessory protein UreF [Cyanophyceae cyanobacterium]